MESPLFHAGASSPPPVASAATGRRSRVADAGCRVAVPTTEIRARFFSSFGTPLDPQAQRRARQRNISKHPAAAARSVSLRCSCATRSAARCIPRCSLAPSAAAGIASPTGAQLKQQRHTKHLHLPTALPFHLLLLLFFLAALSIASRGPASFSLSAPLYYIPPWPMGYGRLCCSWLAAVSPPVAASAAAASLSPPTFSFFSSPLGHCRAGARWLAPPHGRARPVCDPGRVALVRCNSR